MRAPPFVILNCAGQWDLVLDDYGQPIAEADVAPADAKAAALVWLRERYEFVSVVWEAAGPTAFIGRVLTE